MRKGNVALLALLAGVPLAVGAAGKFTDSDYQRALWMATRYYGGQRSGKGVNWLLKDHTYKTSFVKDADGSRDLTGGWFDCGDHVLFGQTFFYSAYVLAKAYDAFPQGFEDNYHGVDYSDYEASSNWDKAGGSSDGIPDLLQELKYATDWMIKATPDGSTFYSQKGDGDLDHKNWVTAGKMSTLTKSEGGESDGPRSVVKNPSDGSMPGLAAATLAAMSRFYRKYDAAYADTCLAHAKFAYAYASSNKGASVGAGNYYPASKNPWVGYVAAASELYAATGDGSYKSDGTGSVSKLTNHYYTLCYANQDDLGYYDAAALLGVSTALGNLRSYYISSYVGAGTGEGGLSTKGDSWGALRYPANQAFSVALYSKAAKDSSNDAFIYNQVDYILGANNAKESFLVGFCSGCNASAQHPHHRNVYLNDNNPTDAAKQALSIPTKNRQFGSLVGGNTSSSSFASQDLTTSYQYTEGGIDYNAGLVGALAYIVSKRTPVDTSKFNNSTGIAANSSRLTASLAFAHAPGSIEITSAQALVSGEAYDLSGRRVAALAARETGLSLSTMGLKSGLYLVRVRTAEGQSLSHSVMVY